MKVHVGLAVLQQQQQHQHGTRCTGEPAKHAAVKAIITVISTRFLGVSYVIADSSINVYHVHRWVIRVHRMKPYPGQVDGSWQDVDIHQVIHHAALYVT